MAWKTGLYDAWCYQHIFHILSTCLYFWRGRKRERIRLSSVTVPPSSSFPPRITVEYSSAAILAYSKWSACANCCGNKSRRDGREDDDESWVKKSCCFCLPLLCPCLLSLETPTVNRYNALLSKSDQTWDRIWIANNLVYDTGYPNRPLITTSDALSLDYGTPYMCQLFWYQTSASPCLP